MADIKKEIWRRRSCALAANRIVKDYTTLRLVGSGVEIEEYVAGWIDEHIENADRDFHDMVMQEVVCLMQVRDANNRS
jgi:hypothetical protein